MRAEQKRVAKAQTRKEKLAAEQRQREAQEAGRLQLPNLLGKQLLLQKVRGRRSILRAQRTCAAQRAERSG